MGDYTLEAYMKLVGDKLKSNHFLNDEQVAFLLADERIKGLIVQSSHMHSKPAQTALAIVNGVFAAHVEGRMKKG